MQYIEKRRIEDRYALMPWLVCGLAAVFYFYESLLRVSPSVMSTQIMHAYGIGAASFGNLVACYYYIYTPMQLPVGVMMDYFGPRRLLTLASALCALGTYMTVSSSNLAIAELGRFFIGFGSSFAFVGVLKLGTMWLSPRKFAFIAGSTMSLGMIGALTSDLLLTVMVKQEGWIMTSMHFSIIGLILVFVIYAVVRDKPHVMTNTVTKRLALKDVMTMFSGLVRNKDIWRIGLIGCLLWLPLTIFPETWGVKYLKEIYHFNGETAARAVSLVFLGWASGGPLVGYISNLLCTRREPILVGSCMSALCISLVLYIPHLSSFYVHVFLYLFGLFSSVQVLVFPMGREISGSVYAGTSISIINMFVMFSGVLQPIIGVIMDAIDRHGTNQAVLHDHIYSAQAYHAAFIIMPIGLVLAGVLSWFVGETYGKSDAKDGYDHSPH